MTISKLVQSLRECELLADVSDSHLDAFARVCEIVNFPEGQIIFREGELASEIYLLISGSVSLEVSAAGVGNRRIMTLSNGELLGWSPILGQTRLTATARALMKTSAIKIRASQALLLCDRDPHFGFEFMRGAALALAKRLSATRLQLLDVYGSQMPQISERDKDET